MGNGLGFKPVLGRSIFRKQLQPQLLPLSLAFTLPLNDELGNFKQFTGSILSQPLSHDSGCRCL